ncbi:MAG: polyphosphate polymerase domain-containing protein [Planctomycetota bacterium]|nr:polyphosphate polymerase domain-containing protein [Planctomycetota bacterium]
MSAAPRYELKFPVTLAQKHEFMQDISSGLVADANGVSATYRVSSMYFDTDGLQAYWQKMDGEALRKKYRLRFYTAAFEGEQRIQTAFMEIKHRINDLVFKERVQLTDNGANAILADSRELTELSRHVVPSSLLTGKTTVDTIRKAASVPGFSAVNVISYLREAWEGSVDRRLRLTFDSSCQAYTPKSYLDVALNTGNKILQDDEFIMEVKFDEAIPRWIRDVIAKNGIRLSRFSKYAFGVERLQQRSCAELRKRLTPFECVSM